VSVIDYNGSIWFIDDKSKYWYLEVYKKTKTLWWRLDFFENFFILFGMEQNEFVPIISEWVEEVLNGKIVSTFRICATKNLKVEEVLNGEIGSTNQSDFPFNQHVEDAVGVILKGEVVSTRRQKLRQETQVEEILNAEGVSADSQIFIQEALCHQVLSRMIETTTPDPSDYFRVEDALNSI
jgi:hypothetical protein